MNPRDEMYQEVQSLIESDRQEKAIRVLEKMLESYPEFAPAHCELGALYLNSGRKTKALEHYHESINLEPLNAAFLKGLADCYYVALGNADEAAKLYHKVIEIDPYDITALMILGNLAVVENKFDTARDFYQRVLDIEPWNHEALSLLEKFDRRKKSGDTEQFPESSYLHIQELIKSGNIEEAIKDLENLLAMWPEHALAHNDLGVLYYQNGATDKTLNHYEEAVRLEPGDPTFQKNLADFYCIEQGRIKEALEIYLKVLTEEPTDIETLMAAAQICKALNRNEQAKMFFDRVLDLEPWNLEANENLNHLNQIQRDNRDASFNNSTF